MGIYKKEIANYLKEKRIVQVINYFYLNQICSKELH